MLDALVGSMQRAQGWIRKVTRRTAMIAGISTSVAVTLVFVLATHGRDAEPPPRQPIPLQFDSAADDRAWRPRGSAEPSASPSPAPAAPRPFYVVVSPQSNGNRYMVSLLVAAGCAGRAGHGQPFDMPAQIAPDWPDRVLVARIDHAPCAAMHRSMPHAGVWVNISRIDADIRAAGWEPRFLVMLRAEHAAAASQVAAGHARTQLVATDTILHAQQLILAALRGRWFRLVLYEQLARDDYRRWLFSQQLGLELPPSAPAFREHAFSAAPH